MKEFITAQEIRLVHPDDCACATDSYYARFANKLYEHLRHFVGKDMPDKDFTRVLARKLTWYFEDIVADMGVWRMFSDLCMELYGYPVPMYHAEEEYYPDEPSYNAVRYLVWDVAYEMFPDRLFDTDRLLLKMGQEAYRMLNEAFENAPINEEAKAKMDEMISYAGEGFNELRNVLGWMLMGCYITSGSWTSEDIHEKAKELQGHEFYSKMNASMKQYVILSDMKFTYHVGPLALKPYQWLGRLAKVTGHDDVAKMTGDIDVLGTDTYKYKYDEASEDSPVTLENTHGKVIEVSRKELNLDPKVLQMHNGCVAAFVFYKGEWRLNGVIAPLELAEGDFEAIRNDQDDIPKEGSRFGTAEDLLKWTDGQRIVYFKDSTEMLTYLRDKLKYPANITDNKELKSLPSPCMFIDDKAKIDNQCFAPMIELSIKDPANPYYDPKKAKEEAINILWDTKGTTSNFADYLIDQNFLPDAEHSFVFSQEATHEQRIADMHFFVRTSRRSKY